jgi:hypothetical protein
VTGRRWRPAEVRRRADEMAALLDEAAPRAARGRRRRATAVPAAVAAFGALSIGGVGLALGLTPTGAEGILPASPAPALADPASTLPTTDGAAGATTADGSVADPAVAGADLIRTGDHRASADATAPAAVAAPASAGHPTSAPTTRAPRSTSARPGPTTTRPRPTSSRPTPTTARSATPRATSTRPAGTRTASPAARPAAQHSSLPTTGPADDSTTDHAPQEPAAGTPDVPSPSDEDAPQE